MMWLPEFSDFNVHGVAGSLSGIASPAGGCSLSDRLPAMSDRLLLWKGSAGLFLRGREYHTAYEARAGCSFGFVHNPFEMFLDGIFAEIHPPGDFFVGKSELEVNDDHLFAFG
jgi:hypothetical protein